VRAVRIAFFSQVPRIAPKPKTSVPKQNVTDNVAPQGEGRKQVAAQVLHINSKGINPAAVISRTSYPAELSAGDQRQQQQ
jgi:hypothetical protein